MANAPAALLLVLLTSALVGAQAPRVVDRRAAERLGAQLFFDPRLSVDGSRACAGCHLPQFGWTDREPKSLGVFGRRAARNAPSIVGAVQVERVLFRDGRVSSLEEFVAHPVSNPNEMANTPSRVVEVLASVSAYPKAFGAAFGDDSVSFERVSAAVASFVRTLSFAPSRFSRFLSGEKHALNEQERRGWRLFSGTLNCSACHSGERLTDDRFHATGTARAVGLGGSGDAGRYAVTGEEKDRGAFRTPSLLNVALTPPYFHDGSAQTLRDVIAHYERAMPAGVNVDPLRPVVVLDGGDRAALLAFLKALDATEGGFTPPEVPR